ncbi:ABC transporter substrate-binding protein [Paenactinomyces guangxiensis]|uniref:Sugar ABC transporter substrate-binding protein n=1 Tax=Paenactinomyces guangxiensis TaxID=1490290 RepID=A0A7W1WP20_9BACL|nr:sugar ABC transporter substrate-binding protein [Paenactinomyces guangxiensis]MBA4493318.1 sugar ABC transporter substrate-binding protein [Paenactinomyces guangxiensis]MBH8589831.1 sugar ABC transporter substrate-binding protein [Paenactinomyces guangxiensis]
MRKRVWNVLLSAIIVISLLAGCADGYKPAGANGRVTIKFYTHGNGANYNWKQTIAAFEKKYPNIKVDLVVLSEKGDTQEATKKLDLAAASGEEMDVLMFSDPATYAQRVGLGMVAPLDDFIAKEGYKVNEEYKVDTKLNGKYYALPGKFNPWYVLLNKDHLDEAGLPVPKDWTWDQFMDYAKKLKKGSGATKRYGVYFHGPQGGGWMEYLKLALGNQPEHTEFIKADGSSNLDSPLFRKSLEMRLKMEKVDKSSTPYEAMLSQKLHYRAQFFNQSASMILIGSWMNTELGGTDQFPLKFQVAVAPYPKNAPGDPGGYTPVTTDYMAIAANSTHKEEAYKFIRWYTTEGQLVQGKNIPSWNKVKSDELSKIVDSILSQTNNPEKVDKESLNRVLSQAKASKIIPPVSYQAEIYKAINEEYEMLIFGKQDLDTTVKKAQERVQKIIDTNKK